MANEHTHHTYNIPIAADVRKKKKNNKPRAASGGGRENDTEWAGPCFAVAVAVTCC